MISVMPPLKKHYTSLRSPPHPLTKSSPPIQRLRHKTHKAYYTYQVTFSAYMLSDTERLLLDLFIFMVVALMAWCLWVVLPWVVRGMLFKIGGMVERDVAVGFKSGLDGKGNGNESGMGVGSIGEGSEGGGVSLLVTTVFGGAAETGGLSSCAVFGL